MKGETGMRVQGLEIKVRRIAMALAGTAVIAVGNARAFNPQPEPPAFGIVGLSQTQTAILNAVLTQPPDPARPACELVLSFVDADGQPFHDAAGTEITKRVMLQGAKARSLQLRPAEAVPVGQTRAPIRAVVSQPPDPQGPSDCTGLVATLELVSRRGLTQMLYASPAVLPPAVGGQ
jgi:hypothetical protein